MEKINKEMGALKYFEYVFEDILLYMESAKKQAVLSRTLKNQILKNVVFHPKKKKDRFFFKFSG